MTTDADEAEIQKLRAELAELQAVVDKAERDHCGCLGMTLFPYSSDRTRDDRP